MKPRTCILLSILDICLAQRWKLNNACSQHDAESIEAAFAEGVTLAETAYNVMENDYGSNAQVQQMVKYILGDGADLQAKVEKAKGIFGAVKSYDKTSYMFLSAPFIENKDLLIFCDNSNYQTITVADNKQRHKNKVIDAFIDDNTWSNINTCYDTNAKAGGANALPMAITTRSDGIDQTKYKSMLDAWVAAGSTGAPPDITSFIIERTTKPNTMDLCTWYLAEKQGDKWPKVDADMIAKVQDPAFIAGLKGNDKAIDALSQTLGATFLHELTHTNFGGKTLDNPSDQGCYGWVCVGALHDPNNADSISMLGVALTIWKLGFYVDKNGLIQKLP